MARQTYYITREQRNPLYRTRMLQAGPIELDAGAARLYRRLGVELSDEKPKGKVVPAVEEVLKAEVVEEKPKAAAPKAAPKKKAPRKRKTAKRA